MYGMIVSVHVSLAKFMSIKGFIWIFTLLNLIIHHVPCILRNFLINSIIIKNSRQLISIINKMWYECQWDNFPSKSQCSLLFISLYYFFHRMLKVNLTMNYQTFSLHEEKGNLVPFWQNKGYILVHNLSI